MALPIPMSGCGTQQTVDIAPDRQLANSLRSFIKLKRECNIDRLSEELGSAEARLCVRGRSQTIWPRTAGPLRWTTTDTVSRERLVPTGAVELRRYHACADEEAAPKAVIYAAPSNCRFRTQRRSRRDDL